MPVTEPFKGKQFSASCCGYALILGRLFGKLLGLWINYSYDLKVKEKWSFAQSLKYLNALSFFKVNSMRSNTIIHFYFQQESVSRKSRKVFGPGKPFIKIWTTHSEKMLFQLVFKIRNAYLIAKFMLFKIQCQLSCPKTTGKVSGLLRNARVDICWHALFRHHIQKKVILLPVCTI